MPCILCGPAWPPDSTGEPAGSTWAGYRAPGLPFVAQIAGPSEAGLRLVTAGFGMVLLAATWIFGRLLFGPAAGVTAAAGVALTPLIFFLPKATLAATIIVAVLSLVDFSILKTAWRYSKADFLAVAGTIGLTLGAGVEAGLARFTEQLDHCLDLAGPDNRVVVLLETTAGQGSLQAGFIAGGYVTSRQGRQGRQGQHCQHQEADGHPALTEHQAF